MKIGIDARMFSDAFTGIGRYNFELTKRFFAMKPDIEWVLFLNEPEFSQFEFPQNVKKVCVKAAHYSLAEQTKFLLLLNKEKCDLVWFTHFNRPLFYFRSCVVTIHDTTLSFYPGKKMGQWWRKLAYKAVITIAVRLAKTVITVSRNTRSDVIKLFHISPKKGTKEARLKYELLGVTNNFFLLEVDLLTGRHHQIRSQLSRIGCSIKGDELCKYHRQKNSHQE